MDDSPSVTPTASISISFDFYHAYLVICDRFRPMTSSPLTLVASLSGHEDRVWNVAWSPDGQTLASCGADGSIRLWHFTRTERWECAQVLDGHHTRTVRRVAWHPSGRYIAAASFDGTVSVWSKQGAEFEYMAALEGHENEVKSVAWDASGSLLASCSRDKSVWIWESTDDGEFECVAVCTSHSQDVKAVTWHPSKEELSSFSYDDTAKVWVCEGGSDDWTCKQTLEHGGHTVWDGAYNESGDVLATVDNAGTVRLWNTSTWTCLHTIEKTHSRTIYGVSWKGNRFVTGGGDNALVVREMKEGGGVDLLGVHKSAHQGDVNGVVWAPSELIASCGDDEKVNIWKLSC